MSSNGLSQNFQSRNREKARIFRGGERWGDVDLEQAVVRVRSSYTGGTLGTPKNRERRDVDPISDVVELLSGGRRRERGGSIDDLVFPGDNGSGFLSPTVLLRRHLYPAMAAAEIRRVGPTQEKRTFHSYRHTFAKRALESGAQSRGSPGISAIPRSR